MQIKVNGLMEQVTDNSTLKDFLQVKKLTLDTIVVVHNTKILDREQWNQVILHENDTLEVLHFVGGG